MVSASRNIHRFLALITVVTALTWALGLLDIQFSVKQDMAFANGFPGETAQWQPAGDWSNVDINEQAISVFRHSDKRSFAKRTFQLPDTFDHSSDKLRINGTVETLPRELESDDVRGAAYMIWLQDEAGEVVRYLTVQELTGSKEVYDAERIVSVPEEVSGFALVLNSRDANHGFSLTDASVQIISTTPHYLISSAVLVLVWLIILLICFKWFHEHASWPVFTTACLLIIGIIVGVMLPESMTLGFIDPLLASVAEQLPALDFQSLKSTYKIGHFVFFLLISLLLAFNANAWSLKPLLLLYLLILLAIASEGMQLHLFNRTTRLSDLGIDGAGILVGWLIGTLMAKAGDNSTPKNPG